MSAEYWIAQHIADLFRNEPRNVGVIVRFESKLAGKFYGQRDDGSFDGRQTRSFPYQHVYEQWVEYWQSTISSVSDGAAEELTATSGHHYRVIDGGTVDGIGEDSIEDVVNYLFPLLVSTGGLSKAFGLEEDIESPSLRLTTEITVAFRERRLLAEGGLFEVPHPIQQKAPVSGWKVDEHVPDFIQRNGRLSIMESIDFTIKQKQSAADRAGRSAYMFRDVTSVNDGAETIAIIKLIDDDKQYEQVRYGLEVLTKESEVVNWLDPQERHEFLQKRESMAKS